MDSNISYMQEELLQLVVHYAKGCFEAVTIGHKASTTKENVRFFCLEEENIRFFHL